MIRLLIADSHPLMLYGYSLQLKTEPDIQIVGEAHNGHETVKMAEQLKPDIILLDVLMPNDEGNKALIDIKKMQAGIKVIVNTIGREQNKLDDAMELGADAFLPVNTSAEQAKNIIRRTYQGLK